MIRKGSVAVLVSNIKSLSAVPRNLSIFQCAVLLDTALPLAEAGPVPAHCQPILAHLAECRASRPQARANKHTVPLVTLLVSSHR